MGEHDRRRPLRRGASTPTTRWCPTCRTTSCSSAPRRPARCSSTWPGLPALDGTRAESRLRVAHRRRRPAARASSAREPAARRPPRLGGQRQRQLLAAEPRRAARGLRPDHRLRGVRAHACAPAWSTATSWTGSPAPTTSAPGARSPPRTLRLFEHTNRVFAAELARENGDLQTVCEAADGGRACEVLAAWDGRSDLGEPRQPRLRGVLEAGAGRRPLAGAVRPGRPDRHPARPQRDQPPGRAGDARRPRLAARARASPSTPRGAACTSPATRARPLVGIGGGEGDTGNANVTVSRTPAAHLDRYSPVSYGSSHIQAVAFGDGGPGQRAHDPDLLPGHGHLARASATTRPGCSAGSGGCASPSPPRRSARTRSAGGWCGAADPSRLRLALVRSRAGL